MLAVNPIGTGESLDGKVFDMVSSTASAVSSAQPTRFRYHQSGSMLWGEYDGDTVLNGRFVGTRADDRIAIRFVHVSEFGDLFQGKATALVTRDSDGLLVLLETFRDGDGKIHTSECVQVLPPKF